MSSSPRRPKRLPWYSRPGFTLSVLVLVFFVGLGILGHRAWEYHLWSASAQWPVAQGEVLRVSKGKAARKGPAAPMGRGAPDKLWATVEYAYTVEGQRLTNDRVTFATSGTTVPLEEVGDFKNGQRVEVHYDPATPSRAVLVIGERFEFWTLRVAIALFLVALGLVRGLHTLREG